MALQRRSLLISGAVASMAPALSSAATSSRLQGAGGGTAPLVMHQPEQPASVAFATAGTRPTGLAMALPANVGAALYGMEVRLWRHSGRALCGLTTAAIAFCIERAATDAGYRTVWRERHAPR